MKQFIGFVKELEVVPDKQAPSLNAGYNTKKSYYAVIEENQPIDDELLTVDFIMWTSDLSEEKIKELLQILNK